MKASDPHSKIPHEAIQNCVEKILRSSRFRGSGKQRDFLKFIVDETLAGRTPQIKGYTIALAVYGRKEGFDPQLDPIVRVEAGRLRRALEHYYLTDGKSDPVRIEIAKGGYVPSFIEVPDQAHPAEIVSPKSRGYDSANVPSIAVMPLTNLSDDDDQDYFVDGLTEELTNELSRYQDFHVIASQSTMRFKDTSMNPGKAGDELGVRFLLLGSARRSAKNIKVNIQLLDTASSEQIWAESYKRKITAADLIDLQEEVAHSVTGIIADQYGLITRRLSKESRKRAPEDLRSYDAVLRFYYHETQLTADSFNKAIKALEEAIRLDPDYGLAWAMLGHLYADNYALGFCDIENTLDKALIYANKGISLDPENQFTQDALSVVYFQQGNKKSFLEQAKKIIELNPNSPYCVGVAGWHMALFGEWDQGLPLLQKGMKLNPFYPTWFHLALFMDFYRRNDFRSAYSEALKFNYPSLYLDPLMRAAALGQIGKKDQAESTLKQMLKLAPDFKVRGRELLGYYIKVDSLIDKLLKGLQKAGLDELK